MPSSPVGRSVDTPRSSGRLPLRRSARTSPPIFAARFRSAIRKSTASVDDAVDRARSKGGVIDQKRCRIAEWIDQANDPGVDARAVLFHPQTHEMLVPRMA